MSDGITDAAKQTKEALEYVRRKAEKEMNKQQHCGFEYECTILGRSDMVGTPDGSVCCKTCEHDTRSRPHTSAPAPSAIPKRMGSFIITAKELEDVEQGCINDYGDWSKHTSEELFDRIRSRANKPCPELSLVKTPDGDEWLCNKGAIARKARKDGIPVIEGLMTAYRRVLNELNKRTSEVVFCQGQEYHNAKEYLESLRSTTPHTEQERP